MEIHRRLQTFSIALCAFTVSACGGGGSGGVPIGDIGLGTPPPPSDSPGGIWIGTDSAGDDVVALVSEGGYFNLIGDVFNQGQGDLDVSNGNDASGFFSVAPEFGTTLPDGTTSADCGLSGTVVERTSMTVAFDCTTTAGLQHQTTMTLNYDELYERVSLSLGDYVDDSGNVLNITAQGEMFLQNATTGCVINGTISPDGTFNMFSVLFDISNCMGQDVILNDSSYSGQAVIDDAVVPEQLVIAVFGSVGDTPASIIGFFDRI